MSQTDPIADFLTRLRNASHARMEKLDIPASRMRRELAEILKREGFIQNFRTVDAQPRATLRLYLKYTKDRKPFFTNIERVSKPGMRKYAQKDAVPSVFNGMGLHILSTSKGVMTDAEAKAQGVGGELLCRVW
ncbi:MAG: 30S ribosomal protein S8 [Candidatus Omnitrophica bacterium]|nr:30S ribosomal protein S8 [Candidatus Omnitrophota bacterium]